MRRLFVFGCSFTSYNYPTWADFLGENFDEYHNYGLGGACNQLIFGRFIEADTLYNFNENDYIIVMLSSIDRFSFYNDNKWKKIMDYDSGDFLMDCYMGEMHSNSWGLFKTFTFTKTIHDILSLKNIKHKIIKAFPIETKIIQNDSNFPNYEITKKYLNYIDEITNNSESLCEFTKKNYPDSNKYYSHNNIIDRHPTIDMHYEYYKKEFPNYVSDKTELLFKKSVDFMNTKPTQKQIINFFKENIFVKRKYDSSIFF
jgi:hypothetical protein